MGSGEPSSRGNRVMKVKLNTHTHTHNKKERTIKETINKNAFNIMNYILIKFKSCIKQTPRKLQTVNVGTRRNKIFK